jgi:hypothetical protein
MAVCSRVTRLGGGFDEIKRHLIVLSPVRQPRLPARPVGRALILARACVVMRLLNMLPGRVEIAIMGESAEDARPCYRRSTRSSTPGRSTGGLSRALAEAITRMHAAALRALVEEEKAKRLRLEAEIVRLRVELADARSRCG